MNEGEKSQTAKPVKPKRTRKVGELVAFSQTADGSYVPVPWDAGVKTKEQAKKVYVRLNITGKIILMRNAGSLEAKVETITRFA